jgi:hypothetical protein
MKKYLAGSFDYIEKENYYTDDFKTFYNENDEKISEEDMQQWALFINSPWSQKDEMYKISVNCENAYIEIKDYIWKCEYIVTSVDFSKISILGYGNTEVEALNKCIENLAYLQNTYNIENDSV